MSFDPPPQVQDGSRLSLNLDASGLTVYGNKAGLISLAERLLRIAQATPDECFEVHTIMELGDPFGHGNPGEVVLNLEEEIASYFSQLEAEAPADAKPFGFELTFMHVDERALGAMKVSAQVKS